MPLRSNGVYLNEERSGSDYSEFIQTLSQIRPLRENMTAAGWNVRRILEEESSITET